MAACRISGSDEHDYRSILSGRGAGSRPLEKQFPENALRHKHAELQASDKIYLATLLHTWILRALPKCFQRLSYSILSLTVADHKPGFKGANKEKATKTYPTVIVHTLTNHCLQWQFWFPLVWLMLGGSQELYMESHLTDNSKSENCHRKQFSYTIYNYMVTLTKQFFETAVQVPQGLSAARYIFEFI